MAAKYLLHYRYQVLYVSLIIKFCLLKTNQNITSQLQINEKKCSSLTESLDDNKYDAIDLMISVGRFKIMRWKFDLRRILPLKSLLKPGLNYEKHLVASSFSIASQLPLGYKFTSGCFLTEGFGLHGFLNAWLYFK